MTPKHKKTDKALALKVANDIAEFIDCGETRQQLRDCIRYFADELDKTCRALEDAKHRIAVYKIGMKLAQSAMKETK